MRIRQKAWSERKARKPDPPRWKPRPEEPLQMPPLRGPSAAGHGVQIPTAEASPWREEHSELMVALARFRTVNPTRIPTHSDVLEVLKVMGYRRVAPYGQVRVYRTEPLAMGR